MYIHHYIYTHVYTEIKYILKMCLHISIFEKGRLIERYIYIKKYVNFSCNNISGSDLGQKYYQSGWRICGLDFS